MELFNLRYYSQKRRAPKNVRCASPVPGTAASSALGRRNMTAKAPQLGPDLLSKPKQGPCAKKQIGNANTKALPKIQENSNVSQMDCLSAEQSVELNYNENRGLGMRAHIGESSATPLKNSLHLNSENKESLRNSETSSEMTLPTGVSAFLLDCLDVDSTVGSDIDSSDRADSYSSPEIFRNGSGLEKNSICPEGCLGCKNSTLLDTSKAINMEKMPQLSNLSEIFEASLGGQDKCTMSERPSKRKRRSELTKASTIVAGKQVCKILSAKENTPQPQSSAVLLLPQKQQKQHNDQRSRNMKCRKKVQFTSIIVSSPVALSSDGESTPTAHHGAATGTLVSKQPAADVEIGSKAVIRKKNKALLTSAAVLQPEDLELGLPLVHKVSNSEDFFPNMTDPHVNPEEIHLSRKRIPESISPERTVRQCLHNPPETCCIITASPDFRPPKVLKRPLNKNRLFPLPGVTEDIIISPKNWIYNHDR